MNNYLSRSAPRKYGWSPERAESPASNVYDRDNKQLDNETDYRRRDQEILFDDDHSSIEEEFVTDERLPVDKSDTQDFISVLWSPVPKTFRFGNGRQSDSSSIESESEDPTASDFGTHDDNVVRKKRVIGNYEVIQILGKGSQGLVLKARNLNSPSEFVAIKTLRGGSLVAATGLSCRDKQDGRFFSRMRPWMSPACRAASREIALLKKVDHPNIVRLIDVVDTATDKDIHLVLEFCTGGPLRQLNNTLLSRNSGIPLPEDEVLMLFRQLVLAVRYLHYHGIVHRDIKPSNLIVDRERGILKLSDLGIATQTSSCKASKILGNDDDLMAYSRVEGTPAFLPPEYYRIKCREHCNSKQECYSSVDDSTEYKSDSGNEIDFIPEQQTFAGRAADVWATGVTLYAFIYGSLPHTFIPRSRGSSFSKLAQRVSDTLSTGLSQPDTTTSNSGGVDILRSETSDCHSQARSFPSTISVGSPNRSNRSSISSVKSLPLSSTEMEWRIMNCPLKFPGVAFGVSGRLRHLLTQMLEKNPTKRISIEEVCNHVWIQRYGPLPALSAEQRTSIEPSRADRHNAVMKTDGIGRFKVYLRRLRSKFHIALSTPSGSSRKLVNQEFAFEHEDSLLEHELFE